jgi:hypothetical protein
MTKTLQTKLPPAAAPMSDLIEITHDRADAVLLAADVFAITAHRAQRVLSAAAGLPTPRTPKPRSRYLRHFLAAVSARIGAIARLFDPDELERLKKIGAAILLRLERNDTQLMEEVLQVVSMEPEQAVAWIREHLDKIEARFAS